MNELFDITRENALIILEKYLKKENYEKYKHSIRVAKICKVLAQTWNAPVEDAIISGLLHDIGKSMNKQELLTLCMKKNLTIYDFELYANPMALHGKISSLLFEDEFNTKEPERFKNISHAISCHVAGSTDMNILDKVLFISDNIEPKKRIDLLHNVADGIINSPDECIKKIINDKISKSIEQKREVNPLLHSTLDSLER